jgi:hypothetical protein
MLQRLRSLYGWAGVRSRLVPSELDFGELVAVLIVMLGLISFASAGLWTP